MISREWPRSRSHRRRARGWLLPLVIYVIPWLSSLEVFVGDHGEALEELGFSFHELSGHNFSKALVQSSAEKRRVAAGAALAGAAAGALAGAVAANRVAHQSQSSGYAPCLIGNRKQWEDSRKGEMQPTVPERNLSTYEPIVQQDMTRSAPYYSPTELENRDGAEPALDASSHVAAASEQGSTKAVRKMDKNIPVQMKAQDVDVTDAGNVVRHDGYHGSEPETGQNHSVDMHQDHPVNPPPSEYRPSQPAAPDLTPPLREGLGMPAVHADADTESNSPNPPDTPPQLNETWTPQPVPQRHGVWRTRGKLVQGGWHELQQIRAASETELASNSAQVARRALEVATVVCSFTQGMATMSSKLLEEAARDTQRAFKEAVSEWHYIRQGHQEWVRAKSLLSQSQNSSNASSR
mmetsp:Transcript_6174/g.14753  ORF Transcript_6174/g.14753 Transcript_6174/m.14753 type:complete len:408 (-) Transcript_6174:87-1310(-)